LTMSWMGDNFREMSKWTSTLFLLLLYASVDVGYSGSFSISAFILPHPNVQNAARTRTQTRTKKSAITFEISKYSIYRSSIEPILAFRDASRLDYDAELLEPFERLTDVASNWYMKYIQPKEAINHNNPYPNEAAVQIKTLVRVGIPSISLALIAGFLYTPLSLYVANDIIHADQGVFTVVSQDSSQYIQNILTTSGLMFSILTGYTYYFMYQQQEQLFVALFQEVSEAKSLLEQVSLICAGRQMYPQILQCIQTYVEEDLKYSTKMDPAEFIATRAVAVSRSKSVQQKDEEEDPLEAIMYMTSVGTPSQIYDTILSLRRARANRLGALQQKLPDMHILLLKTLAIVVLVTFPVCGAGSQVLGGLGILRVQSIYFGILVFGIAMVLNVISELFKPRGGAYNIDGVLSVMVSGLDEELRDRLTGVLDAGNPYFRDD